MNTTTTRIGRLVGSLAAVLVAVVLLGGESSAAPFETVSDPGSKAAFKRECKSINGVWDEGQASTSCTIGSGSIKVCDENGKNCTWHPAQTRPASDPFANPLVGAEPLPNLDEQDLLAADADGDDAATKGKKGKKGGKGRKR